MSDRTDWCLDPNLDFLNHGSFGATPRVVMQERVDLLERLERDPISFLAPERDLEASLDHVRHILAELINVAPQDLAFVRNATDGVNAVLRSLAFEQGDEVLITNHGYNACNNAVRFATQRSNAITRIAEVPFPLEGPAQVLQAIEAAISDRTRLLVIDHVTSATGLVFPVRDIIKLAHQHGIRVMIDGAHAPGMLPLDLRAMQPDYYTANHHKWLCGPKASGFLYVRADLQSETQPTIISHAYNRPKPDRSQFTSSFDWMGTHDPTPILALPAAIQFLSNLRPGGLATHMHRNHEMAVESQVILSKSLNVEPPCPAEMIGSLVSIPLEGLSLSSAYQLGAALYAEERIEAPVFEGIPFNLTKQDSPPCVRVSLQCYNSLDQVQRLGEVLRKRLNLG
ncbi:MAG: aminotransferase class V-fold PLP-dependent enzyme [Planctomycetaceae bacterium]|nr:aminotransferase class V-fold PLP-dependent enzyme [Planctomycetaceae bacterium]